MKKSFMSLIVFFAANTFAQDIIVKKDGSTIMSKVLEIGTSEIKYKKFSNKQGPTYTIATTDVMAINYENGEKEDFQKTKEENTISQEINSKETSTETIVEQKANTKEIRLDIGTEIPLQNINYVKAADLSIGQSVNFRVSRDIKVDNVVLIPYGTTVKGFVYQAKKSSSFGTKGKLGIRIDKIALPDGKMIPVNDGDIYVTGKNRTALSVCLFLFVTWPACFITGSKAELPAGYELITKVANPVVFTYKNGKLTSEQSIGIDSESTDTNMQSTYNYPHNANITKKDESKFAIKAGVGLSSIVGSDTNTKLTFAYKIGAFYDLGLSKDFAIIPGIEFATKGYKSYKRISMSYLQIPIFAAYKFNLSDEIKLAIKAGPYISYGLFGSHFGRDISVFDSDYGFNRFDAGIISGISLDFDQFMVGLEYSHGLIKLDSNYSAFNQAFGLVFGYKF